MFLYISIDGYQGLSGSILGLLRLLVCSIQRILVNSVLYLLLVDFAELLLTVLIVFLCLV